MQQRRVALDSRSSRPRLALVPQSSTGKGTSGKGSNPLSRCSVHPPWVGRGRGGSRRRGGLFAAIAKKLVEDAVRGLWFVLEAPGATRRWRNWQTRQI